MTETLERPSDILLVEPLPDVFPEAAVETFPGQSSFEALPSFPNPLRRPLSTLVWLGRCLIGFGCLLTLLTMLAVIPIVNLLVLGYLLEASGQVARTGKLRWAMPMLPAITRIVTIILGIWLWLLPVKFLARLTYEAWLIAPEGASQGGRAAALVIASVLIALHLLLALARGGSFGCFFRPLKNILWLRRHLKAGDYGSLAWKNLGGFVSSLRLPELFRLGLLAYAGGMAWLLLPTLLFAAVDDPFRPWQWVATIVGGLLLIPILCWLPFLQTRLAVERRWGALFELRATRELFRHSPFTWVLAAVVLFGLSLLNPLYHFVIRYLLPAHEARWDMMLVFLISVYPARIFLGWAYHRATRKPVSWVWWHWLQRVVLVALVLVFVFILFFTPMVHPHGRVIRFEHPTLLLPLPY